MKGSEALLRAIAAVGEEIPATQLDSWMTQLIKANLLERETRDDDNIFYYRLTDTSKEFLRKKGVTIK